MFIVGLTLKSSTVYFQMCRPIFRRSINEHGIPSRFLTTQEPFIDQGSYDSNAYSDGLPFGARTDRNPSNQPDNPRVSILCDSCIGSLETLIAQRLPRHSDPYLPEWLVCGTALCALTVTQQLLRDET